LYFALQAAPKNANPVVWMLNPWMLNQKVARKGDVMLCPADESISRYVREPFSGDRLSSHPIAVEPPLKSNRIAAQRGMFTLHGRVPKPLESYRELTPHLKKIVILRSQILDMKDQLRVAGFSETTVFPELSALCKELIEFWRDQTE
jgi:hypothetical protein